MSEVIKHECGIVLIRLLKPLSYYEEKYGTPLYGLNKLYLLMEKQHNRGQDGAGVAVIKLDMPPGSKYISRERSNSSQPIKDIFEKIYQPFHELERMYPGRPFKADWLKQNLPFVGEVLLGHLRYGTHGENTLETVHPFLRQNNWMTRNLVLAGNFNLTNVDDLFNQLVSLGQHPKEKSDTVTVQEKIGHFLDEENQRIFDKYKPEGYSNRQLTEIISRELDLQRILHRAARDFDGGYTMVGMIGNGDAFVMRDPNGIRPAWFYASEEVVVAASERPAILTCMNVSARNLQEIPPGHALVVKKDGSVNLPEILKSRKRTSCSFERIYFSRGTDPDIYRERKRLGQLLMPRILKEVDYDLEHTVFSFIPNTAEVAFFGMLEALDKWLTGQQAEALKNPGKLSKEQILKILERKVRIEKVAMKDVKLRTFITQDQSRDELVSHVYDITYGSVVPHEDNLVIIDDSIVRGTTLQQSILSILDRLEPKKIVVVSSAPQIRYPDCYGIDMSRLGEFVAFRAAVSLVKKRGMDSLLEEIYHRCKESLERPVEQIKNEVKALYEPFEYDEISREIARIVKPSHMFAEVKVIYQTLENLHQAVPGHTGDWYFSGNYPTPGGNRVVNRAFVHYIQGKNERAY